MSISVAVLHVFVSLKRSKRRNQFAGCRALASKAVLLFFCTSGCAYALLKRTATAAPLLAPTRSRQPTPALRQLRHAQPMDARAALEGLDCAHEISKILDCGLDKETLSICLALLENGVNPEACWLLCAAAAPPAPKWLCD